MEEKKGYKLQMNKIMVVGCGVYQYPLIERAHRYGEVIVVAPEIPTHISENVICYYEDVRDEERILEIGRNEKITAVVTDQTDIAVRTVAYVAEKLGLPGIGYETAILFTNKALMRQRMEKLGLPVLPYLSTRKFEQAAGFMKTHSGSMILKPVDNQGSRGVCSISSLEELEEKYKYAMSASNSGEVVIEKMATGREFVVEGMVNNYQYETLICGDTHYFDIPDAYAAKSRVFPSIASPDLIERVCELNRRIIEGFGLKHGITHSEFILDGDQIYMIETAARGGGVFISSDLIHIGSGLDTEDFLIQLALRGSAEHQIKCQSNKVCGYVAFFLPDGIVKSLDGIDEVRKLPYVHRNLLGEIYVGMEIHNYCDKTSRFSIIVSADSMAEFWKNVSFIKDKLRICVQTENGEKSPVWE